MTLDYFSGLLLEDQIKTLRDKSVYLCKRRRGDITYFLYQMNSFYVEVLYNHYSKKVTNLFSFRSTLLLEPYLKSISLKHLS